MSQQFSTTIYAASTWVLPLLLVITLREAALVMLRIVSADDATGGWDVSRLTR